ncbi:GIY-YIG nuclease family protein [Candidatus Azambacteria bacterium]|nr:GIY-YIG nuclease family protein [Candidatus Azambacteria bacterium]
MWYLYILLCNQKTFYVGITDNLARRLKQHKNKESFFYKEVF